jgi:PAS domain S-box-containing protein
LAASASAGDAALHAVQHCDDGGFVARSAALFLGTGIAAGEAALVIATEAQCAELEKELAALGHDVASARSEGRYVELEAARTLAALMRDGLPDAERFAEIVAKPLRRALAGRPAARVYGAMVTLLAAERNVAGVRRLESLWDALVRELPLAVRCPYSARSLEADAAVDQEALARLAAIVETSDDAIVSKNLDGIVTSWNASAERIFGWKAEEMIGSSILRIIPPERRDESQRILSTIRNGERVSHFETERVRKDGVRIHISVTVSPIRDGSGRIVGASKIARDVTERRRLETEREALLALAQRACADAQAANSIKDEFLATLSHELRNPLSAVRSAVVSARLEPRERERALDLACRQVDQLSRLVDDLLDLSRIHQGRVRLNKREVGVDEILARAAETTRFVIEERGHRLRVTPPPAGVRVEGDPVRLEQIVVNLLTNAAKYTPPGGRIEVVGERVGDEAVIRVRDNGEGIAPAELARVFDLFVQGHRTPARAPGGLGIGLTVVRSLVALHGGHVAAHSEGLGKGAEFVVSLPALASGARAAGLLPPRVAPPAAHPHETGVRVMIVEDHTDAAESLAMLLELFGHQACAVGDGFAALERASAEVPDLMLVDVGLPGMDGYEFARRARETETLREVPLVALTGYARDEDRRRALAAGFDHHLAKPVDPTALRTLLGRVARGERLRA